MRCKVDRRFQEERHKPPLVRFYVRNYGNASDQIGKDIIAFTLSGHILSAPAVVRLVQAFFRSCFLPVLVPVSRLFVGYLPLIDLIDRTDVNGPERLDV